MRPGAPRWLDRAELVLGVSFWIVAGATAAVCGALPVYLPYAVPLVALLVVWPRIADRPWARPVLDWLPFPLVVLTYGMLHAVVPACGVDTIDAWLVRADHALLGGHAAARLGPLVHPVVTVLMSGFYASYYVLPVALGVRWYRRDRRAFRELMLGAVGALFIGYLGYLFLPAVGPHAHLSVRSLGGVLEHDIAGEAIRGLNARHGGVFPRDAFPSLHTANAVTALVVALRHERRALVVVAPLVAGLVAATVYLRFHYVVDVLAGAALALAWHVLVVRLVARELERAAVGLQSRGAARRAKTT